MTRYLFIASDYKPRPGGIAAYVDTLARGLLSIGNEVQEGFGIAFIEANACGIPTVGTRAGGIPDAILDGMTGMLVGEESHEELARVLGYLYRHPEERKRMGHAGMDRAHRDFSPVAVASRFHRIVTGREGRLSYGAISPVRSKAAL